MNRSKIEWCDHTWNPITGCLHNCEYCYARTMTKRFSGDVRLNKMAKGDYRTVAASDGRCELYVLDKPMLNETGNSLVYPFGFEPTLHRYRYDTLDKLKMGNNIFVGAMADVFGKWVPEEWIMDIFEICEAHPQHNYMFLTKNSNRYLELEEKKMLPWEDNFWFGTTITNNGQDFAWLREKKFHWFLSIEPILEDLGEFHGEVFPEWIIIGAETGKRKGKVVPEFEWIKNIVLQADNHVVPVFMKDSLIPIVGEKNMRRDFPHELMKRTLSDKMHSKLYDICCDCRQQLKKNEMITLQARSCRGEVPKQFAFMCKKCFRNFCGKYGVEVPELKNMEDKKDE